MTSNSSEKPKGSDKSNVLIRLSSSLIQMGIVIGGSVYGGHYLDQWLNTKLPVWTIVCSLIGIGAALYLVIRGVGKINND